MDKRNIVADIKASVDGAALLNVTEVARYLGVCRDTARLFLRDVECLPVGKDKKYLAVDIARKIYETRGGNQ